MRVNRNHIIIGFVAVLSLLITVCNVSYETAPDAMQTGLHPVIPKFSTSYHGTNYRFPVNSCDQTQCHGSDLTGGNSGGPSCFLCHNNTWSVFSTTHVISIKGYFHHSSVDRASLHGICGTAFCHGTDLTGVSGRGHSCYACHNPIPLQGHRVNYEGVMHHVDVEKERPDTYCNIPDCHGTPNNGPLCTTCHDGGFD